MKKPLDGKKMYFHSFLSEILSLFEENDQQSNVDKKNVE